MDRKAALSLSGCFAALAGTLIAFVVWDGLGGTRGGAGAKVALIAAYILAALLVICLVLFLAFFFRSRKSTPKAPTPKPEPPSAAGKRFFRRGILLLVFSFLLGFLISLGGLFLPKPFPRSVILWSCAISPLVFTLLGFLLSKGILKSFQSMDPREMQQRLLSYRENAAPISAKKRMFLRRWRRFSGLYALLLALFGIGVCLCSGSGKTDTFYIPTLWYGSLLLLCALGRIHLPLPKEAFSEEESYLPRADYPELYALADRAAAAQGCQGELHIALTSDCNAGIAQFGRVYSIQLGTVLLLSLSQEEVFCVLLHEFAHVSQELQADNAESAYSAWLERDEHPNFFSGLASLPFLLWDTIYLLQYNFYDLAAAVLRETEADAAMGQFGDPQAAASCLRKLSYYNLFQWELAAEDRPCLYRPEEPESDHFQKLAAAFLSAMERRRAAWDRLIRTEILPRNADHPTTQMRLEALGQPDAPALPVSGTPSYLEECQKAAANLDHMAQKQIAPNYAEYRKEFYLEPKAKVEAWQAAGEPLSPEGYRPIVEALQNLGEYDHSLALCQRAIDELPAPAACFAVFTRGTARLHRYDAAGLSDLYTAMAGNSNYIQDGLDLIGTFCCLTGNQAELDVYREKAMELTKAYQEKYSQIDSLKNGDHLEPEHLPQGMLEDILPHILSGDGVCVNQIYLVRKVISPDLFTSAFVLFFSPDATEEQRDAVLNQTFLYLDTCSDWQFSLFDRRDVPRVKLDSIPGSCVYTRTPRP